MVIFPLVPSHSEKYPESLYWPTRALQNLATPPHFTSSYFPPFSPTEATLDSLPNLINPNFTPTSGSLLVHTSSEYSHGLLLSPLKSFFNGLSAQPFLTTPMTQFPQITYALSCFTFPQSPYHQLIYFTCLSSIP